MLRRALRPRPRASSLPSAALAAALLVPVGLLAGCSGDDGGGTDTAPSPEEVLALAKATLDEVYAWDQVESQGLKISVEHPTAGPLTLPGPPLRFFEPTGAEWHNEHTAPPLLGQHTDEVLNWLSEPANP